MNEYIRLDLLMCLRIFAMYLLATYIGTGVIYHVFHKIPFSMSEFSFGKYLKIMLGSRGILSIMILTTGLATMAMSITFQVRLGAAIVYGLLFFFVFFYRKRG